MDASVAEVAVPLPLSGTLSYHIPPSLRPWITVGHVVPVPIGRRRISGCVVALREPRSDDPPLRDLGAPEPPEPLVDAGLIDLWRWAADYYGAPLGEVVRAGLPAATRSGTRSTVVLVRDSGVAAALLARAALDPAVAALRERLIRGRGVPSTVIDEHGLGGAVASLHAAGLVRVEQVEAHASAAVRTEEVFALVGDARSTRWAFPRPGPVRDRLIDWLERMAPVGRSALIDAFPDAAGPLRQLREKGLLTVTERELDVEAAERVQILEEDRTPREPTAAQVEALTALAEALRSRRFAPFLLRGVTGSGKTEVYLHAAARVLDDGGSALLLVPEIGLTPQFLARFRARFGEDIVAVLHSGLSERQRFDEWIRIRRGRARLVVGARSAVWAPVVDLRLVVVDEEHDGSYKQEDGLRYHARDVAIRRAQKAAATVILGSATPSLESVRQAQEGRYRRLDLPARVADRPMPQVRIIDLRLHPVADPEAADASLSPPLRQAIVENHQEGGQTILLLNRRGFATTVICTSCGAHMRCGQCDLSMTYHGRRHRVVCHGCGAWEAMPEDCPACLHPAGMKLVGRGTERVEEELLSVLPGLRIDRMDADTTRSRSAHRRILDRFRAREVDLLVGTQMVAKGHDFPGVTLVGVLHADASLHLPDFRASERTFSLIAQVAGRAGRGDRPGRVVVQTWHPDHHAIRLALDHDWEGFVERELPLRRGLWYPPFARLLMLRPSATDERVAETLARATRDALSQVVREVVPDPRSARVLGPAPAPLYRLQGRFRWQILLKAQDHPTMSRVINRLRGPLDEVVRRSGGDTKIGIDRDPVLMM